MKTIQPKLHTWFLVLTGVVAIGGSGVVLVQAQQAPTPASICARPEGLLTNDDREAIAKVIQERVREKLGLGDQQAKQIQSALQARRMVAARWAGGIWGGALWKREEAPRDRRGQTIDFDTHPRAD